MEGFHASLQVAVLAFFNDPWARVWSHGHTAGGPRKRFVSPSISAVLGKPFPLPYQALCLNHGGFDL